MGITGLLPIVKPIIRKKHISHYKGQRVGVDGHVWLHGVTSYIAHDLYRGAETDRHVPFFMEKVRSLAAHGITPVLVFDGDMHVCKEKTARERQALREKYRAEVEFHLLHGQKARAHELMRRSVGVTPHMLAVVLAALRVHGVEYIVSPYEADAQLCFLQKISYIDCILTVDSDLIVYGSRKVLYKYAGGYVDEYDSTRLHLCKDEYFRDNILDICILSGCDYVDSIRGVGIATAHKKLQECGGVRAFVDAMRSADRKVPANYMEEYARARLTFLHHIVYNPLTGKRQHLSGERPEHPFLGTLEDLPYLVGNRLGADIRIGRHFVAPREVVCTRIDAAPCDEKCEIDANLVSPYFE